MNKFLLSLSVLAVTCATVVPVNAQDVQGNAQAGEKKIAMCIGCHGIQGYQASFPEVYKVPMISGQTAKYIVASLGAYKKGERKHPTMRSIADNLSEQDMADMGAYYESLGKVEGVVVAAKALVGSARVNELLAKGACMSCHGDNFSKPVDPSYPKLAGQYADYLFVALKSYKIEGNPNWGRANPIMGAIVKPLSNAELKELARYLGSLPGELQTTPQAKFR